MSPGQRRQEWQAAVDRRRELIAELERLTRKQSLAERDGARGRAARFYRDRLAIESQIKAVENAYKLDASPSWARPVRQEYTAVTWVPADSRKAEERVNE